MHLLLDVFQVVASIVMLSALLPLRRRARVLADCSQPQARRRAEQGQKY